MKKTLLLLATAFTAFATPALADRDHRHGRGHGHGHSRHWKDYDRWDRHDRHYYRDRDSGIHISLFGGGNYYPRPVYYRESVRYVEVPRYIPAPPQGPIYGVSYQEASGRYCREYTSKAYIGSRLQETYGTACYQPDGSWELMQ